MQSATGEGRAVVSRACEDDELSSGKAGTVAHGRRAGGDGEPASCNEEFVEWKDRREDGKANALERGDRRAGGGTDFTEIQDPQPRRGDAEENETLTADFRG